METITERAAFSLDDCAPARAHGNGGRWMVSSYSTVWLTFSSGTMHLCFQLHVPGMC